LTVLTDAQIAGLKLLRAEFPANQISKLPKPTKAQTDAVKADYKAGIRCHLCGGWHHKDVVHLDYVGHAALTDRLLSVDPAWSWEPVAFGPDGLPAIDKLGGIWIRLTVLGVTRLGYGHPDGKSGGDAIKEAIGDALRNAGMRFGCALDLWHKGDLHAPEDKDDAKVPPVDRATTDEIESIKFALDARGSDHGKFLAHYSLGDFSEIKKEDVQKILSILSKPKADK